MTKVNRLTGPQILAISKIIDEDMNWDELDFAIELFSDNYELKHLKMDSPLNVPMTRERLTLFTVSQMLLFLKELYDANPDKYFVVYNLIVKAYPEYLSKANVKLISQRFEKYSNIVQIWEKADIHLQEGHFRESVDNSRLAIELLCKDLFENEKSLENQKGKIGELLKNQPKEFKDLVISHIRSYEVLQNEQFKHNFPKGIEEIEVRYILKTTFLIMDYLERKGKENDK